MGRFLGPVKTKLNELYEYRNMVRAQVIRTLFGRYKNSVLGFAWNFIMPLVYMALSYVIFSEIRQNSMDNFIVFLSSGIFIYSFILSGITGGAGVFTSNSGMIKKMYFPKEVLVISNLISGLIVALIGYVVVILTALVTGHGLSPLAIPVLLLMLLLGSVFFIGCSLLLGSLTVYVRDVQYALSAISMAFFVCTPIRSMMSDAEGMLATIYELNPLTYFIEPVHQMFYLKQTPDLYYITLAALIAIAVFIVGYAVFKKLKRGFVERL